MKQSLADERAPTGSQQLARVFPLHLGARAHPHYHADGYKVAAFLDVNNAVAAGMEGAFRLEFEFDNSSIVTFSRTAAFKTMVQ